MADGLTSHTSTPNVESLLKFGGALILGLYVLGLLAINGYLFSLGASDFSLVRARFVYTGGLIALCGLVCLVPFFFLEVARRGNGNPIYAAILVIGGLIASISYLLFAVNLAHSEIGFIDSLKSVVAVYTVGTIGGLVSALALGAVIVGIRQGWGRIMVMSGLASATTIVILAASAFTASFMYFLFPHIPDQFGGGRPVRVTFLMRHDEIEGIRDLGLPIRNKGAVTESVELMYEGSEAYIVRLPDDTIIRVNRDGVQGLRIDR